MMRDNSSVAKRAVFIVVIMIMLIAAINLVVFWINSGQIAIEYPKSTGIKNVSYCEIECESPKDTQANVINLPKGDYSFQVTLDDGTTYLTNASVGGFLSTTKITVQSKRYSVWLVAPSAKQYVLPFGNSYLTYESDSVGLVGDSRIDLGSANIVTAGYINSNKIIIVKNMLSGEGVSSQIISLYDTGNNRLTELSDSDSDFIDGGNVYYASNYVYAIESGASGWRLLKISESGISYANVPSDVLQSNDNSRILSFNDDNVAILQNGDKPVVRVYSTEDFSQVGEITLKSDSDITSLSLSPDGSKVVAMENERPSNIYEVKTGKIIYQVPCGYYAFWTNNNSFIYKLDADRNSDHVGTVFIVDVDKKESYNIVDDGLFDINSISDVVGNKVYLTATPNEQSTSSDLNLGGYEIDLKEEVGSYSVGDDTILGSLPYEGATYYVGYHISGSGVVIDIESSSGYRNSAIKDIYNLGFDPADYQIQFSDYTNPFKEYK